jgi:hypothetical protein
MGEYLAWIIHVIAYVDVIHFMSEVYGYLTQDTAQISRNALASGSCDRFTNRGLAPFG